MTDPDHHLPLCNRVDPWGDLHVTAARGMFTGNRGCLVDDARRVVRHHVGRPWITCLLSFRGHHHPLDEPHRWTPLFFLDEAVALAAGHRPCAYCRREDFNAFRAAVATGLQLDAAPRATEIDRSLSAERLRRGRGFQRAGDRIISDGEVAALPVGTVVLVDGHAQLVCNGGLRPFAFSGWGSLQRAPGGRVAVLTPPTSVAALAAGYEPVVHPSAR